MIKRRTNTGFSLVEMSFVLIIIGLVIMTVFPALRAVKKSTEVQTTRTNMEVVTKSVAAFIHAHGCMPCPTPTTVTNQGVGYVRGDTSGIACADCITAEGIVPYASLGIPQKMAKDGWGNWMTMQIDPVLAVNRGALSPTGGICTAGLSSLQRINVTQIASSTQTTSAYAYLLASHGLNGKGAYKRRSHGFQRLTTNLRCPALPEDCNIDGPDTSFRDADYTNSEFRPFDDQLLYLGRNALVAYFGNASCQTSW